MAHPVLLLAFVVFLVTVGVACLFYPRQFLALNERLKGNWIKQAPRLMGPKQEIWNARITGVGAILMAAFICYEEPLTAPTVWDNLAWQKRKRTHTTTPLPIS